MEDRGHLVLVRQSDHAMLSGWLAATWGALPWTEPEPFASTVVGARLHDLGWTSFDEALQCRSDGRPYAFHEVARSISTRFYLRGLDAVEAIDQYAGLLASLHLSGFFTSHWGWMHAALPPALEQPAEREAVQRFVGHEIARQRRLRASIRPGTPDRQLMCNYFWLQLWDRISLDICRHGFTGWSADYPETPFSTDPDAPRARLHIDLEPGGVCRLAPYPLRANPYRARIPAVRVPLAAIGDAEALRSAWRAGGGEVIDVTFRPA